MAAQAQRGDTVIFHLIGRFQNGEIFEASVGGQPHKVVLGAGNTVKGIELALEGMYAGQEKRVIIYPEDAYGHRNESLVQKLPKTALSPEQIQKLQPGSMISLPTPNGGPAVPMRVIGMEEENILIDANHPLAGKTLTCDLKVLEVRKGST